MCSLGNYGLIAERFAVLVYALYNRRGFAMHVLVFDQLGASLCE